MPLISSQPMVPPARPVLAGSMIHFNVAVMSSQLIGLPSDHCMPVLRVHVTSMPAPFILTPPLAMVGTLVTRVGTVRRSGVTSTRLRNMPPAISMSVSACAKYGLTVSGNCHSATTIFLTGVLDEQAPATRTATASALNRRLYIYEASNSASNPTLRAKVLRWRRSAVLSDGPHQMRVSR